MHDTPVTYDDVEVVASHDLLLKCRIAGQLVVVGSVQILPGTTVQRLGDRGRLVIRRWAAEELKLPIPK